MSVLNLLISENRSVGVKTLLLISVWLFLSLGSLVLSSSFVKSTFHFLWLVTIIVLPAFFCYIGLKLLRTQLVYIKLPKFANSVYIIFLLLGTGVSYYLSTTVIDRLYAVWLQSVKFGGAPEISMSPPDKVLVSITALSLIGSYVIYRFPTSEVVAVISRALLGLVVLTNSLLYILMFSPLVSWRV